LISFRNLGQITRRRLGNGRAIGNEFVHLGLKVGKLLRGGPGGKFLFECVDSVLVCYRAGG
jgi:hypothetical protein